ncbi:MAG: OST-HTH/LOTUS domain-containing protein, partial [Actinobacteria bacterium]|nr:OST-HTH/LOTUS domain-containing protein [Actinomycetota bacterium]
GKGKAITRKTSQELKQDTRLVSLLRNAVEAASDDAGWAQLSPVGSNIAKQSPEFDPRNYGYAKLSGLVAATELFEIDERALGSGGMKTLFVRDKRNA